MPNVLREIQTSASMAYRGLGYLAGEAPADPGDPDSPDGRTKMLGVLTAMRLSVHERRSLVCIADTVSATDGTWRIDYIDPAIPLVVMFWNHTPELVDVGGVMRPINGFMQDWIHAEPYGP